MACQSTSELNNSISDFWEKNFGTNVLFDVYPSFIPDVKDLGQKRILYIGLNPAYQGQPHLRYNGGKIQESKIIELAQENVLSRTPGSQNYYAKFFNPIHDFHSSINYQMNLYPDHYDLFPFRMTDSKSEDIRSLIYNGSEYSDFTQLCLSNLLDYLRITRPILVIVNNAMSSSIIKDLLFDHIKKVPELGIYTYKLGSLKIFFLFTGTWQYGRLDKFTKDIYLSIVENFLMTKTF